MRGTRDNLWRTFPRPEGQECFPVTSVPHQPHRVTPPASALVPGRDQEAESPISPHPHCPEAGRFRRAKAIEFWGPMGDRTLASGYSSQPLISTQTGCCLGLVGRGFPWSPSGVSQMSPSALHPRAAATDPTDSLGPRRQMLPVGRDRWQPGAGQTSGKKMGVLNHID